MKVWHQFLRDLETQLGKQVVDQWLSSLRLLKFDARNLHLEGRDKFQILWFYEHVASLAKEQLRTNDGLPIQIHFYLQGSPWKTGKRDPSYLKKIFPPTILDPHATFENFIVETEKPHLPYQTLESLSCHSPARYNPIYLFGKQGTGKSHLLMATAHQLQQSGFSPRYVTGELFTQHVIQAFRSTSLHQFRQTYRSHIHALLIDNLQHLAYKTATQEELFHTFNCLHIQNISIILSADCAPSELEGIEQRLISRFEWGLTLPLPDPSSRVKDHILTKKCKRLSLSISEELRHYLLHTFHDLHTLTQAVDALAMRIKDQVHPIHLEVGKALVRDLAHKKHLSQLSPQKIVQMVAQAFAIEETDLLGRSQRKEHTLPRQIAIYLCRNQLRLPYLQIGKFFDRNHATVISSVKRIAQQIKGKESQLSHFLRKIEHLFSP